MLKFLAQDAPFDDGTEVQIAMANVKHIESSTNVCDDAFMTIYLVNDVQYHTYEKVEFVK